MKNLKIRFFDKFIFGTYASVISLILTVFSIIISVTPIIDINIKYILLGCLGIVLFLTYLIMYLYYKFNTKIHIKINNTDVYIKFGNIFEEEGKKVIAFNEYFDTVVDNKIISEKSLNGYLLKYYLNSSDVDEAVQKAKLNVVDENIERTNGNSTKYELGQIVKVDDYFLLAFSRFNDNNEAELVSNEYANCLLEMWKQLNCCYNQEIVNIPLLGDGITRIRDNMTVSKQDLLEIMLMTLKTSMQTFKKPSLINIILYPGLNNENYKEFNFSRIKYLFK